MYMHDAVSNSEAIGCAVTNTTGDGIHVRGPNNVIEDCIVHDFGQTVNDRAGIKLYASLAKNNIVRGCLVYNGIGQDDLQGIQADLAGDGVDGNNLIENNRVYNVTNGITAFKSDGTTFRNNIVHDSRFVGGQVNAGIYIARSDNCIAYHNTAYNWDACMMVWDGSNNMIGKNNVLEEGVDALLKESADSDGTYDYNCYHDSIGAEWIWNGTRYSDWDGFKTGSSQEDNGRNEDPLMTNPSSQDFTLQSGSPCRNNGADVGVTIDYVGTVRDDTPDIGAYEYIS